MRSGPPRPDRLRRWRHSGFIGRCTKSAQEPIFHAYSHLARPHDAPRHDPSHERRQLPPQTVHGPPPHDTQGGAKSGHVRNRRSRHRRHHNHLIRLADLDVQRGPIGPLCTSPASPTLACFYSAPLAWNCAAVNRLDRIRRRLMPRYLLQHGFECTHQAGHTHRPNGGPNGEPRRSTAHRSWIGPPVDMRGHAFMFS